ncbi:MAG: hypothetical protein ACRYGP_01220 [Janthinobacterium lividum]
MDFRVFEAALALVAGLYAAGAPVDLAQIVAWLAEFTLLGRAEQMLLMRLAAGLHLLGAIFSLSRRTVIGRYTPGWPVPAVRVAVDVL